MKKIVLVIAFLLSILNALTILSMTSEVSARSFSLSPVEASNPDSRYPDSIIGGQGVWKYSSHGEHRGYLKFDLSVIGNDEKITSMVLNAQTWSVSQYYNPFWIDIHHISDDSWNDESLTWNNKPAFGDLMGSAQFVNIGIHHHWDLSGYNSTADIIDGSLSMVMSSRDSVVTGVSFRFPTLAIETTVIVDNGDNPGTSFEGGWPDSGGTPYYGSRSVYSKFSSSDTYTYQATVSDTGLQEVSMWWTEWPSRCTDVLVDISDGVYPLETVTINQQDDGGKWNILGSYEFTTGTAKVVINAQGGCSTNADAVKFGNSGGGGGGCTLNSKFVPGLANNGSTYYADRTYTITDAGPFSGMYMITTPNDDRSNTTASDYLKYMPAGDGYLYVGYDKRATTPPNWLTSTFTQIPCTKIQTSLSSQGWLDVYKREVSLGECVSLGANKGPGFSGGTVSNYIVLFSTTNVGGQCGGSALVAPVAKTGQTTKYADGDDGDLQKGVAWPIPRFTDNGDGTVTDNLTGLIWTKDGNLPNGPFYWTAALAFCNGLVGNGSVINGPIDGSAAGDWVLANINELESLRDRSQFSPALPSGHPFSNVQGSWYWSATTNSAYSPPDAWNINFANGFVSNGVKSDVSGYVWCVRGEP